MTQGRFVSVKIALIFALILFPAVGDGRSGDSPPSPMDIVVVLDNSGSMKKNDPGQLSKKALSAFLKSLPGESRVGIVLFADRVEEAFPLQEPQALQDPHSMGRILDKLQYGGRLTNIPAGFERALYELKQRGRMEAHKAVVLLTDGHVDLGDARSTQEKKQWLQEDLVTEARGLGIAVFGLAFTEQADFQLLQSLAQRTGGNYYRATKAEDLEGVFQSLIEDLLKPFPRAGSKQPGPPAGDSAHEPPAPGAGPGAKPSPPADVPSPLPDTSKNSTHLQVMTLWAAVLALAVALAVFLKTLLSRGSRAEDTLPEAYLEFPDDRLDRTRHRLTKKQTVIGRHPSADIFINQPTISKLHARILYENGQFYLMDNDSTNGTLIADTELAPREKTPLYGGEEIVLDRNNRFRLVFTVTGIGVPSADRDSPSGDGEKTVLAGSPGNLAGVDKSTGDGNKTEMDPAGGLDAAPQPNSKSDPNERSDTWVKESLCPTHPRRPTIGQCALCGQQGCDLCIFTCSVCGRTFCKQHVKEGEGRTLCGSCTGEN